MNGRRSRSGIVTGAAAALLLCAPAAIGVVHIETVPVGNAGNAPDTRYQKPGVGAVDYEFNIGKHEVTAAQYAAFLNAVAGADAYGLYSPNMWTSSYGCKIERYAGMGTADDPYQYRVAADWADRPVNYVSWGDAARFANWLHNGQPTGAQHLGTTEDGAYYLNGAASDPALLAVVRDPGWKWAIASADEWYKAAYHKNDGPTANYFDYTAASDSTPSNRLRTPDWGNNATFWDGGYTIGSPYWRTQAGDHENSDSPYGTFDQGGNVWEWDETPYFQSARGQQGGSFFYGSTYLRAMQSRAGGSPTMEASDVGFRVSQVPEPASMSLLALGCTGALMRPRRIRLRSVDPLHPRRWRAVTASIRVDP